MDKQLFRSHCLRCAKTSLRHMRFAKDKKIALKLEQILRKESPKSILFYLPMPMEVNLSLLLQKYKKRLKVFVPFIVEESFKMVEWRLPLEKNSFGIFEPKAHHFAHKQVDLIIVPVVGIDANMQRVGFGKGMYDRFFTTLPKKPTVVFVQRDTCKTTQRICDDYDIQCDYYISSKEFIIN